jgi:methylthioribose-1-phosphate isomerase
MCVQLLGRLARVLVECWHFDGVARPTAVNLKKRTARFLEQNQNQTQDQKIVTSTIITE